MMLTPNENKAVKCLRRAQKLWPQTLWIYAVDGQLVIMRKNLDGSRMVNSEGGVDSNAVEDHIKIEADGGDW